MIKIHCLNPIAEAGMKLFPADYVKTDDFAQAEAVLVRSAAMHDMDMPPQLAAIARAGAGVNNIPLDKCSDKGIVVFNTPGANANGVKELVIAALIYASRDIMGAAEWVKENKEDPNINKTMEKAKSKFAGNEIQGKKLGVIGLGAIGVLVANAANRLGMQVYGYDPYISVDHAWNLSRDIIHVKTKEEIYKECDYITVHTPLLDATKEMINKEAISAMKDGVIILNFARDLLVNDDDLAEALKAGKVAKYVTDIPNAKTANLPNVIATPHIGASTEESETNCAIMAVKEIKDYIENGTIKNSVNFPSCDPGFCETTGRIAVNHRNIPTMLSQFTTVFSRENINISNMTNKSRGNYAYSIFDFEAESTVSLVKELEAIEGVLKVRIIK